MRVKSAVDRRFRAAVFGIIGFLIATVVLLTLMMPLALYQLIIGYAVVLIASAVLLWMLFGTYYELRDDYLYCRSGPFVEKIGYDRISYLGFSDNSLSSMALSSRRIEIRRYDRGYITGTTMISPENLEIFLGYLKQRCQNLDKAS